MAQPEHSDHDVQVVLADVALGKVWAGAVREAPSFDLVHCTYHTLSKAAVIHCVKQDLCHFGQQSSCADLVPELRMAVGSDACTISCGAQDSKALDRSTFTAYRCLYFPFQQEHAMSRPCRMPVEIEHDACTQAETLFKCCMQAGQWQGLGVLYQVERVQFFPVSSVMEP